MNILAAKDCNSIRQDWKRLNQKLFYGYHPNHCWVPPADPVTFNTICVPLSSLTLRLLEVITLPAMPVVACESCRSLIPITPVVAAVNPPFAVPAAPPAVVLAALPTVEAAPPATSAELLAAPPTTPPAAPATPPTVEPTPPNALPPPAAGALEPRGELLAIPPLGPEDPPILSSADSAVFAAACAGADTAWMVAFRFTSCP